MAVHVFEADVRQIRDVDKEKEGLYTQIGQMKVELDWLKKKLNRYL